MLDLIFQRYEWPIMMELNIMHETNPSPGIFEEIEVECRHLYAVQQITVDAGVTKKSITRAEGTYLNY